MEKIMNLIIMLVNAFSLQMLDLKKACFVSVKPVSAEDVSSSDFTSGVGHADTANVLSAIFGKAVAFNRVSVKLTEGVRLLVAQLTGGRLPEGSTTLPEGFGFSFQEVALCAGPEFEPEMNGKRWLGNAMSLQMLDPDHEHLLRVAPVASEEVAGEDWESCLGFANTAACVGNLLKKPCPANRVSVKLNANDVLYVAQVVGGRLPEGATELPEGFGLTFVRVDVLS